jgi:hypothetical protein
MTSRGKYLTSIITVVSVTVTAAWAVFSFGVGQADKAEDEAKEALVQFREAHTADVHTPLERRIQVLENQAHDSHERLVRVEVGVEFLVEQAKKDTSR